MIRKYKFTLATVLLILVLLLMPTSGGNSGSSFFAMIPHFDKLVHCGMFGFLSLVYGFERKIVKANIFNNIMTLVYFAFLTEILQKFTGYRTFDYFDLLADALGIIIGTILSSTILKKFKN